MTFLMKMNYLPNKKGFTTENKIEEKELCIFRTAITKQWIAKIKKESTAVYKKIKEQNISIQDYHLVSDYLEHSKIWNKSSRILQKDFVEWFLKSNFAKTLEIKYGEYIISDESNLGWPNIYWRLVRPNQKGDIGPLHRDSWFWELNTEFPKPNYKFYRLKVWIPIFVELGLNGLFVEPYSQNRQNIKWYGEERDGIKKPVLVTRKELNPSS